MNYPWYSPPPPPPVKYKGLYNQGATCYLNSVLQVLFMTDDFKEAVERYPGTDRIDVQLRNLFGELRNQTAGTKGITKKLDIRRVYEQRDAAEYFEKILNLTSKEASQIFHGELTHRTVCLGCDTYSARIKSQEEERWFQFDDSRVTQMDFQPFQSDNFESSNSAYLLFYRKKSAPAADTQTPEDIREKSVLGGCSPTTSDVDEGMVNKGEMVKETETEIPVHDNERVNVNSEEEGKLPVPHCNVEDRENSSHPMQGNHEEINESNDSLLRPQIREKDKVKTAPGYEEVSGGVVEVKENGGVSVGDENQDYDEGGKQDRVKRKRQQGHISTSSNDLTSEQGDINTHVTPKYSKEVCMDEQIRNEGNGLKEKRDKDRDEKRDIREKGQHEDNEGKREVGQSMRVDPVEKQDDGKDTNSYREVKQGGEKRLKVDSEAASKVKLGADKVESRSETPLTKIHGDVRVDKETRIKMKEDQVSNQGRSSRYERSEQHIQGLEDQKIRDKQLYQFTDERHSDDSGQEKAHPQYVDVSDVEKHAKRSHSERTQDRNRSPHDKTGALVRSRSLPEGQREDGKKDRQVESDEGIAEEKQQSKKGKKKGNYQDGIQKGQELVEGEITLETPKSETRKGERNFDLSQLLCGLSIRSKKAKRKHETETSEQVAAKRQKRWRLSCIGSSDKNYSSESD